MLIIPQCRFCNANKATCSIKQGLKAKLQEVSITEPLRYLCKSWQNHLKYKVGDVVVFDYLIFGHHGYERAEAELTGTIVGISTKKPVYIVSLTQDEFAKIDPFITDYHKKIRTYEYWDAQLCEVVTHDFLGAPVAENLILRKII